MCPARTVEALTTRWRGARFRYASPRPSAAVVGFWRFECRATSLWLGHRVMGHKDKTVQDQIAMAARRDYTARYPTFIQRGVGRARISLAREV